MRISRSVLLASLCMVVVSCGAPDLEKAVASQSHKLHSLDPRFRPVYYAYSAYRNGKWATVLYRNGELLGEFPDFAIKAFCDGALIGTVRGRRDLYALSKGKHELIVKQESLQSSIGALSPNCRYVVGGAMEENVDPRTLVVFDLKQGRRVFSLERKVLEQIVGRPLRTGVFDWGHAVSDGGNIVATTADNPDEEPEECSGWAYSVTYLVDLTNLRARLIGAGAPLAWIGNDRILTIYFSPESPDGVQKELRVYDFEGRLIGRQVGFVRGAWNGEHIIGVRIEGTFPFKYSLEVWDRDLQKKIHSLPMPWFDQRYAGERFVALPGDFEW